MFLHFLCRLQQLERKIAKYKVYEGFLAEKQWQIAWQCYSKAPAVSFTVITATGSAQFAPDLGLVTSNELCRAVLGCTWQLMAGTAGSQSEPLHGLSLSAWAARPGAGRGWERQIPSMIAAAQFDPGICIASWLGTRSKNSCSWHQHKRQNFSVYQYNCAWKERTA